VLEYGCIDGFSGGGGSILQEQIFVVDYVRHKGTLAKVEVTVTD
jgi:hypothetical protein